MYDAVNIDGHPGWFKAVCHALNALEDIGRSSMPVHVALPLAWNAAELVLVADLLGTRVDDEKAVGAWQAIREEYIDLDDDLLELVFQMADYARTVGL